MLRTIFTAGVRIPSLRAMSSAASSTKLVNLDVNDKTGIATLTLNRPPVNSLNLELLTDISNALDEVDNNKSKGLIVTSSSNKVFSAGLDIMEMYKPKEERARQFWTTLQDVWMKLYGSSYPTAAAINGHSPAGGCLLAMSCEYRVMLPNFTIGLNETQLGIIAPTWFQQTMLRVVSRRVAEYALTVGKLFSTEEALKINLIDEIVPDKDAAIEKCESFIKEFRKIPPFPRSMTKQMLRGDIIHKLQKNRENDTDQFWMAVSPPQTQKLLDAYIQNLKQKQ